MPSSGSTSSAKARSSKKHENETNPDIGLPGIGNYVFERTIGQGNFAKVKLAKHKLTSQEVAVKIIDKTTLDEKKLSKIHREVRIMKMLNHPNIVKLFEVIETKHTLFLVMEYVSGGELYDYLVAHGRMKEKEARNKFRQILSAVNYCHRKRVIHRDLKAENLLLDANLNIKIADFGFSNHYAPDGQLDTFCGSPPYAAPELFQGRKYTGPEVDIWSLGVILYVLCTGCLPFDGKDLKEMREVVCRGRYKVPFYLSDTCEKLLRKFLVRDPTKRASLDILSDDPWINEGFRDSPISSEIPPDPLQAVDEEILRFICDKFNVPSEHVINCLKENSYDDISAIYMLLLDQKQNGKWVPYQSSSGALSPMSPVQLQQGTSTPISRPTPMGTIGEEGEAHHNNEYSSSLNKDFIHNQVQQQLDKRERSHTLAATVSARQRPVTWVGNDNQVQKLMEEMNKQNLNSGSGPRIDNNSNNNQASGAPHNFAPLDNNANQYGARQSHTGHVRHTTAPATTIIYEQTQPMNVDEPAPTPAVPASGQKRNSVIGAIRSFGRRLSESASGYAAQQASVVQAQMQNGEVPPALGTDDKPRSLRFTFNSNTTSNKPPEEIIKEIVYACQKANVRVSFSGKFIVECTWFYKDAPSKDQTGGGNLDTEQLQRALAEVMNGSNGQLNRSDSGRSSMEGPKDAVRFDIEVCELPRLKNLHGLKFRRISGPSQEYKEICAKILATLNL